MTLTATHQQTADVIQIYPDDGTNATTFPGTGSFVWDYGFLPPGSWTLQASSGGTTRQATLTITPAPVINVTSPNAEGGRDFASTVIGDAWDLTNPEDVFRYGRLVDSTNYSFGAAARPGPGYFPFGLGIILAVLGALMADRFGISVAGCHGKTTTSSMLALILRAAGWRPSFLIGGELNEVGTNAAYDEGEWLVVEADESDGTFLELSPEAGLITNVEPDHLDHYGGFPELTVAFDHFLAEITGPRVACFDDPGDEVLAAYDAPFPTLESKAGARGLPMSVPRVGDKNPELQAEPLYEALHRDTRPVLMLWAEFDLFLTLSSGQRHASRIGRKIDQLKRIGDVSRPKPGNGSGRHEICRGRPPQQ